MWNGNSTPHQKIPHLLRFTIFLLRLVLGINFFYLGWGALFDHALGNTIEARSFGDLYTWLTANAGTTAGAGVGSLQMFFAWAFLVIGICLIAGLFTRVMSAAGIVLTLASFLPTFNYSPLSAFEFANGEIVLMLCLLILIFAKAGDYIGIDMFLHVRFGKHKKQF